MPVAPIYTEKFAPVGGGVTDNTLANAKEDAVAFNQDQQAALFQQHLAKGLQGMQEVVSQLPPEVVAQVGDPTAFSNSDEKRVLWYQGVNNAINRLNMSNAAMAGNQGELDRLSLNSPNAKPEDFQRVAENKAFGEFASGFKPTKTKSSMTMPLDNLKSALVSQESGGNYQAIGPTYTKGNGSKASMESGEIALGKYQILPTAWFSKIGLDSSSKEDRERFLATPALQDEAFAVVMQSGMERYNGNLEKVIADYYGGPRAAAIVGTPAGDKPQDGGLPSINEYVKSVKSKMQAGGGESTGGSVITEEKTKTADEVVMELLKERPELIGSDKVEKLLKHLGKSADDIKMLQLAQRQAEEAGKNNRHAVNSNLRRDALESKNDKDLYDDLVKAEAPTISQTLSDIDEIMAPAGGLADLEAVLPGTDLYSRNVLPILKDKGGVHMNSLLHRLYSLELKRISGVAVSDAEFNRYKTAFASGKTFTPEEQIFALRAFVRSYKKQLKLAKSAYGKSWDRVAVAAGIDTEFVPDVPSATGKPSEKKQEPGAPTGEDTELTAKAGAAKAKYGINYDD